MATWQDIMHEYGINFKKDFSYDHLYQGKIYTGISYRDDSFNRFNFYYLPNKTIIIPYGNDNHSDHKILIEFIKENLEKI